VDIEAEEYTIPGLVESIVARINQRISSVGMRANLRMQGLLRETKLPERLIPRLRGILDGGL
jgi:hypothetical protein